MGIPQEKAKTTILILLYTDKVKKKTTYFLFHGETALRKILKFQGETANFREKFSTISPRKKKTADHGEK